MANTRDIRRRIRSVRNTSQLTKAMKMVSGARLRRAQQAILAARPYAEKMSEVLGSLAARVDPAAHPLLARRDPRRVEIVVLTGDRGLCGSFNANLVRQAATLIAAEEAGGREVLLQCVGKKGRDFFRRRRPIRREHADFFRAFGYDEAAAIARELVERFTAAEIDAVHLVYNEFKLGLQSRVIAELLLPVERTALEPGRTAEEYIYEPAAEELLVALLPKHVEWQVYRALRESVAAEHAARMAAMDAATRNAGEMIEQLTLHLNRVRQASITREIIEVVSGAEALN